ncbi:uncharacterized protein LOC130699384 [Daphnia carinata]|uniref:uncharacterized protein LOC130699384 n=1 Tax=Daphnia carinata TaxID=120202 RepID=UPI00257CCAEA|nr:uncharacterized protein LOC130699384 [Daphnia carinata]
MVGTKTRFTSYNCSSWTARLSPVFVILLAVFHLFAMEANAQSSNIITEIRQAFASHKELSRVANYLNLGEKEISQSLMNGQTGSGYTFFAPTNWAFVRMLPQDISDPFFVDAQLRQNVLLHHFVRSSLTQDGLLSKSELIMADGKPSTLTHNAANGGVSIQINNANINLEPIRLASGIVYIVDQVFVTPQQIDEAIRRNPAVETPWGPIDSQGQINNQDVESQTVVVDLVAEFLREEAAAAAGGHH